MRILKPVPVYKDSVVVPSGFNGDEVTSADSIVRIFAPLHNNFNFLRTQTESLYNKIYGIEDTETTDSQTTNINQLPIRVESQQTPIFMSNRSVSELVTVRFNRQTYLNSPIKFLIKNIDKSLAIGSYVYSIGQDFVKIMIKRTGDFYGYGTLVLEMQSDTGEPLASTLLNLRCDPLAEVFKGEFTTKDAWMPSPPEGTIFTPSVLIGVLSNRQRVDMGTVSATSLAIPVTLSGLSYVGVRAYTPDGAVQVQLENTSLTSSGVIGVSIQKVANRGVASSDIIIEGFSPVYGYVSTVINLQIRLSNSAEYPLVSDSVGDLNVNTRIISKLPAGSSKDDRIILKSNKEGQIVIPSHTILAVVETPYPTSYSNVALGLGSIDINGVSDGKVRPINTSLVRISQLQNEKVYGGTRSLGYKSYYVGTIAPVTINLEDGGPALGEIKLKDNFTLIAPNGLGYYGLLDSTPYSFKYDKTPS